MKRPKLQINFAAILAATTKAQHDAIRIFNYVSFFIICYVFWSIAIQVATNLFS